MTIYCNFTVTTYR